MYDESRHMAVKGFVVVNVGGGVASANKVQWWSHYPIEEFFYEVPTGGALTVTDVLVNTEQLTASETIVMDDVWPGNIVGENIFELAQLFAAGAFPDGLRDPTRPRCQRVHHRPRHS
jgi:hypothetical protein